MRYRIWPACLLACGLYFFVPTAIAQVPGDVINLFGGLIQGAIAQANQAEWRKLSQSELSCIDRTLRANGLSLRLAMQRGAGPDNPEIVQVRAECRESVTPVNIQDKSIYFVTNTQPPDAYLSLRTHPSVSVGRRITTMLNGTALQVLERRNDNWWHVKIVASGQQGWAFSGSSDKPLIACCLSPSGAQQTVSPASTSSTRISPSFDCKKATQPDELAICSISELAELDNIVASGFKYTRQKYGDDYARTVNTPMYLARRACRSDAACIKDRQLVAISKYQSFGAPITLPGPKQDTELLWNLNGSTLYLISSGHSRKFLYKNPRPAMFAVGVREDSVLFEGEAIGNQYRGTAFFSSKCGRTPVSVTGPILNDYKQVQLRGQAPLFDANCRITKYIDSTLTLDLIEPTGVATSALSQHSDLPISTITAVANDARDFEHFKSVKEKALAGESAAQVELADLYATGKGTKKDLTENINWLNKAAEQGNPSALTKLGDAYMFGLGVSEDNKEAASWYARAAEKGNATSQYKLGLMYDKGTGTDQNGPKAIELLRQAAAQGHEGAKKHLANIATTLTQIKTTTDHISSDSGKVANLDLRKSLKEISERLNKAPDTMTTAQLKNAQADIDRANQIFRESNEFDRFSRIASSKLASLNEAMSKVYFDAPLIQDIKSTMAAAHKSISDANLSSLTSQMSKLDQLYDPKRIALLREATLHGFSTIEEYDQYLTERAKLGRSGIMLKQK